jgi:gliding motility-associated-like protein
VASIVTGGVGGYSYQWSNNSDSTAIENLPAGDYLLLVTDANGCEIQDVATVIQPDPVFIEIVDIVDLICNGEPTGVITVEGSGGVPPFMYSINGSPFQSEPVFTELFAGDYVLTIMDSEGCMAEVEGFVDQPPPLIVDAGEDQIIELGFSTDIRATVSEFPVSYQWTPSDFLVCDTCAFTGVIQPTGNITYTITATNEDGCMATDSVTIFVIKNRPIYIPNVFSPNGDGLNDGFTVFGGPAVAEIRNLKIFDRWGELIFDQDNLPINSEAEGWDGKFKGEPMTSAVFVYLAEVQFIDGEVVLFDGDVTLLR